MPPLGDRSSKVTGGPPGDRSGVRCSGGPGALWPSLRIDRRRHGPTVEISLHGELDIASVGGLHRAVAQLQDTGVRHLIVDLRALDFVDGTGLHALEALDTAARRNGHNTSFVRAPPQVHQSFQVVGLADHLVFVDHPDDLGPRARGHRTETTTGGDTLEALVHDLRTPLVSLRHLGEDLAAGVGVPTDLGEEVHQEAVRVIQMLRVLAAHGRATRVPQDLVPLAGVALARARHAARREGAHRVTDALPGEALTARVDGERLIRALGNLLDNARAYSPAASPVHLSLTAQDGTAIFRVTDVGMGFTPEELDRATDHRFRSPRARAMGVAGSGLGLTLVQQVADDHDGRLTIASDDGSGATVTLQLPLA